MQKRKKPTGRAGQRQVLLAALVIEALLYTSSAYAVPLVLDDGDSVTNKNVGSTALLITSGQTATTWYGAKENSKAKYTNVTIESGGIWRPMDAYNISINEALTIKKDGILDLSYKYGENYPGNSWDASASVVRGLYANTAKSSTIFYDGAILRANVGNTENDKFFFKNPQLAADETSATVRVQIRYNKNIGGIDWESSNANYLSGSIDGFISLSNLDANVSNNLNFAAEKYYVDDSLHKYLFVPVLSSSMGSDSTTKYYNIDWTATRTDLISQGVLSAANAQLSMRNLWRMEDGLFWKRGEELRFANSQGQNEGADGPWAQVWRGKYSFDGAYGSDFGQNYNGIQVGYDKAREGKLFGGKLYTGLFLSLLNSDVDFHQHTMKSGLDEALYSSSIEDLKSNGIGLYTSWLGDKGHYLDLTVRGSKLNNKYKYYDADDVLYNNDYSTWAYGAGFRYGYQKDLPRGWYIQPQVGISYGTMKAYSFTQANNMRYNQDKMEMLIGRLGISAGRNFGSVDRQGTVYARAAVNHDFKDGGSASADAMNYSSYYQKNVVSSSMAMDNLAGHDTWYEFAVGTNLQTGKDRNTFVELTKTVGGKVNTDWQVNAGMSWRFGGGVSPQTVKPLQADKTEQSVSGVSKTVDNEKLITPTAQTFEQTDNKIQVNQEDQSKTDQATQVEVASQADTDKRTTIITNTSAPEATPIVTVDSESGTFTLTPLVVEGKRPDWEKNLSPGTVSVIHVTEYKGEMKNLPDLLQTVSGVYVQRLSGTGHHTVARVRGSSGGQVNIYIDGVLVNSTADAAVDLSTIPIENVDHIEVYRGYVPARFAGSPLGGAINIVTKKPQESKGSISTGMRSFNGYTGNLELTAPLGEGSLLFALNRDQSKGDFRYDKYHPWGNVHDSAEPRWRRNNDYHNTDALLKWQDDHWFAKLTYKNNGTGLPDSASQDWADASLDTIRQQYGDRVAESVMKLNNRYLETTKTELLLGRRQTTGNLEWGWKLDTSYQNKESTAAQFKASSSGITAIADNEFHNRRYEGAIDGSWKIGKNHLVEFLFDYSRETMNVDTNNFDAWPQNVKSVTGVIDSYKQLFKTDYSTDNYFFQVQDTMNLNRSGNFSFTPVLRAQKMTMNVDLGDPDIGQWLYSYGLGLKKVQNDHWTFRGTYGTYYKFPNFYELFGDGVNVLSRWEMYRSSYSDFLLNSYVEHGNSWDVSANWQGKAFKADTDVTLTYFNREVKNLSTYAINPYGYGYYSNLAAGKIQGVELESKLNWRRWSLLQSITWNDSLITKSGMFNMVTKAESQAGNPFPWVPEWETNTRLSYRFPGDKLTVFGEYHYLGKTGVFLGEASALYDSLGLTNMGLKYDFNSTVKLTAGINDLFNKGPNQLWRRTGYGPMDGIGNVAYPQQGRTYYMTVQYFF